MTLAPDADDPLLASRQRLHVSLRRRFGLNCPIGAHVRRSHPRDSLDPAPGTAARSRWTSGTVCCGADASTATGAAGRRSRDAPPDDPERGLYFICLGANIGRQFEFIQHTWVNNPKFDGLYDEPDPLVGNHAASARNFSIPADPVRLRYTNLPNFVTTRGGGYFFLPGLRALRYLAELS